LGQRKERRKEVHDWGPVGPRSVEPARPAEVEEEEEKMGPSRAAGGAGWVHPEERRRKKIFGQVKRR